MNTKRSLRRICATLLVALLTSIGLVMAAVADHQVKQALPIKLGTSGGNVEDHSSAFCCSGTLGALVTRGGQSYILSNNHVLGLSGSGVAGQDISQPGLIDVGCNANNANTVATFTEAPALGSGNVDAALAVTDSSLVASSGEILEVGVPSSTTVVAALNMDVAKSGRTTGLTCGTISSTTTDVKVQYQAGCNAGKKFTITYTDQVVVGSGTFSAGGDSGSLIVTKDGKNPVALLFAGSSSTTIGNPIQDVVSALGGISFVGNGTGSVTCPTSGGGGGGGKGKGPHKGVSMEKARAAKEQYARNLMQDDAVLGVGVGMDPEGDPAVIIYVEQGRPHKTLPEAVNGIRTLIVRTDAFRAYGWNEKLMPAGACKAGK